MEAKGPFMFGNTRWTRMLALLLVLLLLSARQAAAAPIVDVNVATAPGGLYEYTYTLTNPAGSDEVIFDFGLFFAGDPLDVAGPAGWDINAGPTFINWISSTPLVTDVLPGAILGGFSFRSLLAPGGIEFETTTADALTGFDVFLPVRGVTTGPVQVTAVPEPATLSLLALGSAGVWMRRRRERSRNAA